MQDLFDLVSVSLDAVHTVDSERLGTVSNQSNRAQQVSNHDRLENVQFELTRCTSKSDSTVVTHNLDSNHSQGLVLGRVDLTRHDGRARLVLWQGQLAVTTSWTRTQVSNVVGDLVQRNSQSVQSTGSLNNGIVGSQSFKLVWSWLELETSQVRHFLGNSGVPSLSGVQTGTDSSTTLSQAQQVGQSGLHSSNAISELLNVAGELSAQGQRSSILQVGSTNLDDVLEFLSLAVQRVTQSLQLRKQSVVDFSDSRNVHNGREGVVRRSRHVTVVIWVHWFLGAQFTAQDLNGSVGDNLISVHVTSGTRTGLEHNQWKVVVQFTFGNFGGCLLDGTSDLRVQSAVAFVDNSSSFLQDTKSSDNRNWHTSSRAADLEVHFRSGGLGTIVLGGVNLDLTKSVGFDSGGGLHERRCGGNLSGESCRSSSLGKSQHD
ncbi:conserved hypothetical protein [Clavispora lusitaniae ATCC 42720]|uniref:Uncharacterized protein n=1 Tax=Clavispora lusitaniae (strain ATCC 42720) TaxID=306902 RepID=C4Y5T5_CLAL4|nr:uncharacterized protein CLUG_03519 [Clavispora lusitaniae ATCC 42720]EEQ39392.1 conserved hypothetical protein [Clavispora lusitaniae ATCC 42720]